MYVGGILIILKMLFVGVIIKIMVIKFQIQLLGNIYKRINPRMFLRFSRMKLKKYTRIHCCRCY